MMSDTSADASSEPSTRPGRPRVGPGEDSGNEHPRWWRWRPRLSLSRSVLSALLIIAALGLALSGAVSHSLHVRALEERIDENLAQEIQELRTLSESPDPGTGRPYATVVDLLHTALERNVPNRSEEFLVTVDGRVPFVSAAPRPLQLENNGDLRTFSSGMPDDSPPRYGTVEHGDRTVRFVAAPVQVEGDPASGRFVAAIDMTSERDDLGDMLRAQVLAGVITLMLIAGVGILVFRWLLRPVDELACAAERINDEHLNERVPERGADEIALLARTVNGMLDRLDTAFSTQRALLDDVGHELRTPLTVLRGNLEIMDATDAEDVHTTRDLLLDEIDRVGRLVDELVLLAKSERPDFLVPAPVDIDDVVDGALARAESLAERHFRVDGRATLVAVADRQRLTQALLQLLSNAIRYTEPDDQIAVGARGGTDHGIGGNRPDAKAGRPDTIEIWVRDTGAGIDSEHHGRIFERFERVTAPAGRDTTGSHPHSSGLGLSIVAAIAKAHGGRVDLASAPGRGSTFTLVIPLESVDPGPKEIS